MDFIRFMFCLGVGLVGMCMVLMTVLETVFAEWDVAAEFRSFVRRRRYLIREYLGTQDPDKDLARKYARHSGAEEPDAEPEREAEPAEV